MTPEPLLLTVRMDVRSFRYFNDLRHQHFPSAINHVPAHISLFHKLPGDEWTAVALAIRETCASQTAFQMPVTGVRSLGRGVAFTIRSAVLSELRAELAERFAAFLSPQDRQKFDSHITVQNKVSPPEARALLAHLQVQFEPFDILATGVQCWRYLGGPWELIEEFLFAS